MKCYNSVLYLLYIASDVFCHFPKLATILQPVQEDWEQLGLQLNIDQSVLTDIKSEGDSTKQMKYLLEEWALTGGTITQLEKALVYLGKKEVIPGMLYMTMSTLAMIYQLNMILFLLLTFIVRFMFIT